MTTIELYRWLGYKPAAAYVCTVRPLVVLGRGADIHYQDVDETVMRETLDGRLVAGKLERVTAPKRRV